MKVTDLKKLLEQFPDDAEVSAKTYLDKPEIALVFTLADDLWQIEIKPYEVDK